MSEVATAEVQQVRVAGFAKRSANKERIEEDEKELQRLQSQAEEVTQEVDEDDEEPTSAEEKSFKKRYGDLRRHSQKQQVDLQKQIDDLKTQLESATKQQIKLPKTEEELEAWSREYPDVAKIVETIAIKKAKEQAEAMEGRLKMIDEMQADAMRQKAEAELLKIHPDFPQIRDQEDFHEWVDQQPRWIQQALYENENDAVSAARAIDLYKADKGISTKKASRKDLDKAAAKSVLAGGRKSFDSEAEPGTLRESDIERMSPQEYERRQEEIVAAIRSGKLIYDRTGAGR